MPKSILITKQVGTSILAAVLFKVGFQKARQDELDSKLIGLTEEIDLDEDLENGYDIEDLIDV
jgi:hypothetical protein